MNTKRQVKRLLKPRRRYKNIQEDLFCKIRFGRAKSELKYIPSVFLDTFLNEWSLHPIEDLLFKSNLKKFIKEFPNIGLDFALVYTAATVLPNTILEKAFGGLYADYSPNDDDILYPKRIFGEDITNPKQYYLDVAQVTYPEISKYIFENIISAYPNQTLTVLGLYAKLGGNIKIEVP